MANISICFIILSLFGVVIVQVKCITETFGQTSDNPPVLKENIQIHGEMLVHKKAIIEWPSKDSIRSPSANQSEICGIVHIDHHKDPGHGSTVRFINGGVKHAFVTMELISKRGRGIHSTVLIYV